MILIPSPPLPLPPPPPFLHPFLSSTSLSPFSTQSAQPPPINQPFLAVCWFPPFSLPLPLFSSSLRIWLIVQNINLIIWSHLWPWLNLLWVGKSFSIEQYIWSIRAFKKSSLHCSPWKRDIIHRGEDLFVSDHVINPLNQGHHIAEHVKAIERFSKCLTLVQAISPTCQSFHLATYIHTWGGEKKYILLQSSF